MGGFNSFVFAVGLSALGKKKIHIVHYFQQWQEVGF